MAVSCCSSSWRLVARNRVVLKCSSLGAIGSLNKWAQRNKQYFLSAKYRLKTITLRVSSRVIQTEVGGCFTVACRRLFGLWQSRLNDDFVQGAHFLYLRMAGYGGSLEGCR